MTELYTPIDLREASETAVIKRPRIERLCDEIATLRSALLRYGGHEAECTSWFTLEDEDCTCGWINFSAQLEQAVAADEKGEK